MIEQIQAEDPKAERITIEEMQSDSSVFARRVRDRSLELLKKYGWELRVDNFQWKRGIGVRGELGIYKEGASEEEKKAMESKLQEIFDRYGMYPIIVRFTYYPDGDVKQIIGMRVKP